MRSSQFVQGRGLFRLLPALAAARLHWDLRASRAALHIICGRCSCRFWRHQLETCPRDSVGVAKVHFAAHRHVESTLAVAPFCPNAPCNFLFLPIPSASACWALLWRSVCDPNLTSIRFAAQGPATKHMSAMLLVFAFVMLGRLTCGPCGLLLVFDRIPPIPNPGECGASPMPAATARA